MQVVDQRSFGSFWLDNRIVTEWGAVVGPKGVAVCAALACYEDENHKHSASARWIARHVGMSLDEAEATLEQLARHKLVVAVSIPGRVCRYELPQEFPDHPPAKDWDEGGALGRANHG